MSSTIRFLDIEAMNREVRQDVDGAWQALLDSGDFVRGEAVTRFEQQWARYCGTEHAVGVANGTDAITLALRALDIGPGDEVIVPANTFVATVEAVVLAGATPRFADVEPDTLVLGPASLAAALTPRTRAAIVVHLYGQVADMDGLAHVARAAGVVLLEDAAQAQGAQWCGRRAGSMGLVGCFSFYPAKNLGAFGDAGAVVTSDAGVAERIRSLADHGRPLGRPDDHWLAGTNSRLDTLQAAVLSAKLPYLDAWNAARRGYMARYRRRFEASAVRVLAEPAGAVPVHHIALVRVPDRNRVRAVLTAQGIPTRVHYPRPCHQLRPYRGFGRADLRVIESAASQILSLPLSPHMAEGQVDRVADAVLCALGAREDVGA